MHIQYIEHSELVSNETLVLVAGPSAGEQSIFPLLPRLPSPAHSMCLLLSNGTFHHPDHCTNRHLIARSKIQLNGSDTGSGRLVKRMIWKG